VKLIFELEISGNESSSGSCIKREAELQQKDVKDTECANVDTAYVSTATSSTSGSINENTATGVNVQPADVLTRVTINQQQHPTAGLSPHGLANWQRTVHDEPLKSQPSTNASDSTETANIQLQLAKQEIAMLHSQVDDYQKQLNLIKIQTEQQHQQDQGQIRQCTKERDEQALVLADKVAQLQELESVASTYSTRQLHCDEHIAALEAERRSLVLQVTQLKSVEAVRQRQQEETRTHAKDSSSGSGSSSGSSSSGSSSAGGGSSSTSELESPSPSCHLTALSSTSTSPATATATVLPSGANAASIQSLQQQLLAEMAQRQKLEQLSLRQQVDTMEVEEKLEAVVTERDALRDNVEALTAANTALAVRFNAPVFVRCIVFFVFCLTNFFVLLDI